MSIVWITLGLSAVLASFVVLLFNKLVAAKQLVDNGWSDIEVQLKRRADLIPRLVMTVKAYASHEKQLFIDIAGKRNQALAAGDNPKTRGDAESQMARPVSRLLAVAEDYPELKANQNFLDLQHELSETENTIEMARRFYNGAVRENNTKVKSFPALLIAGSFGFSVRDYFETDTSDAVNPTLDLKY